MTVACPKPVNGVMPVPYSGGLSEPFADCALFLQPEGDPVFTGDGFDSRTGYL